jgi:two-component system, cell cycle sensor histidine kinase and response regulator CckA
MPEMDGPTLFKTARVRYSNLRIIFTSGYSGDVFEKSLPENQPLLPKPFRLGQPVTAVKETMSPS